MLSFSGVTFVMFCSVTAVYVIFRLYIYIFLFGDVAFSAYFCTINVFSLYGEYAVRFSLPGGIFLPFLCEHGLIFLHQIIT